jgi:hypothetical protein
MDTIGSTMPYRLTKRSPLPRLAVFAIASAILLTPAPPAGAQGCALCRDNTASTPPQTQAAYRHGIELLATTASVLFASAIFLLRRQR